MHTQCVYRFKAKTDHVAWAPKTKSRMKKARERRERERERGNFATRGEPNVSLKFVETPWLSYILWNNGLGRENNRFTNEQRLLR